MCTNMLGYAGSRLPYCLVPFTPASTTFYSWFSSICPVIAHGWRSHATNCRRQSYGLTHTLTHTLPRLILINLLIKLGLNDFSYPFPDKYCLLGLKFARLTFFQQVYQIVCIFAQYFENLQLSQISDYVWNEPLLLPNNQLFRLYHPLNWAKFPIFIEYDLLFCCKTKNVLGKHCKIRNFALKYLRQKFP